MELGQREAAALSSRPRRHIRAARRSPVTPVTGACPPDTVADLRRVLNPWRLWVEGKGLSLLGPNGPRLPPEICHCRMYSGIYLLCSAIWGSFLLDFPVEKWN